MHQQLGVAPCALLGALNDKGIAASCEMDVANVVTMRALESASGAPAACLDWNNNYGDDPDKCILFHCGPVARALMAEPGTIAVHKMFAKGTHPDQGWGVNEGRIKPMPVTYASAATMDGKIWTYAGERARSLQDPVEKEFFGCAGVIRIEDLAEEADLHGQKRLPPPHHADRGPRADGRRRSVQDVPEVRNGHSLACNHLRGVQGESFLLAGVRGRSLRRFPP